MRNMQRKYDILNEKQEIGMTLETWDFPCKSGSVDTYDSGACCVAYFIRSTISRVATNSLYVLMQQQFITATKFYIVYIHYARQQYALVIFIQQ